MTTLKRWVLRRRPTGEIQPGDLELVEEPIRDLIQAAQHALGVEDITGVPWIEIDFPEDIARARSEILPQLKAPL